MDKGITTLKNVLNQLFQGIQISSNGFSDKTKRNSASRVDIRVER